jgi:hypothetical protein
MFKARLCFLFIALTLLLPKACVAADTLFTISGIVYDGSSKDPLAFANLVIQGSAKGA